MEYTRGFKNTYRCVFENRGWRSWVTYRYIAVDRVFWTLTKSV